MNEIINKINELVNLIRQQVGEYDKLANERSEKFELRGAELATKDKELSDREAKVREVENVITLRNQALADKNITDNLIKALKEDKSAWTVKYAEEKKALDATKSQVSIDRQKADDQLVMIQKEWIGLKKEQKEWKEKFIEGIKNKVK